MQVLIFSTVFSPCFVGVFFTETKLFAQVGIFECLDADMTLGERKQADMLWWRVAGVSGLPNRMGPLDVRVNYRNVYLSLARSGWLTMDEIYNGLMRLRGPVAKTEIVGFCRSAKGLVGLPMIEYK